MHALLLTLLLAATPDANYYESLRQKCAPDGAIDNCCLSAVNTMEKKHATLQPEGADCPEGTTKNMLKCITTYQWCEPK